MPFFSLNAIRKSSFATQTTKPIWIIPEGGAYQHAVNAKENSVTWTLLDFLGAVIGGDGGN